VNRRKFFAACASVTTVALLPALPKVGRVTVTGRIDTYYKMGSFYPMDLEYASGGPWPKNPMFHLYEYQKHAWRHIAHAFDFAEVEMRTMAALLDEDV